MKSINSAFKQNQQDNTRFPVKHHSFMGGGGSGGIACFIIVLLELNTFSCEHLCCG